MKMIITMTILAATIGAVFTPAAAQPTNADATTPRNLRPTPFAEWSRGPGAGADFFPISVWMQDPRDAAKYKAAGINMYKNLWEGPTAEQLTQLRAAGMPVVCEQNEYALQHLDDPIIVGWIHGDEPDNAQSIKNWASAEDIRQAWPNLPASQLNQTLEEWGQYGPPLPPSRIQAEYERMKGNDPTRPIFLHLGQSVAWDNYKGRGVRTGHPEDYPEYVKGTDVANFDIYPSVHKSPEVRGKLEFVPRGVTRLRQWTKDRQIVSVAIECTRIGDPTTRPKPRHVKAEVWMSITHGARAICYFVHEFAPTFNANGLLDDPEMLAAVTKINGQIHSLARAINSPTVEGVVTVASSNPDVPLSVMTKQLGGDTYIFAVAMRPATTKATFTVKALPAGAAAEVLGEKRSIPLTDGAFPDTFTDYDVHLYRIGGRR